MWKETFLNPTKSPAHHTRTLAINILHDKLDVEDGKWIQAFTRVTALALTVPRVDAAFFTLFYNISSSLKSLRVCSDTIEPQLFDLIHPLLLLEDLTLIGRLVSSHDNKSDGLQTLLPPPPSPVFTGRLQLSLHRGVGRAIRRLLELPNSLHIRRIELSSHVGEDISSIVELVSACSESQRAVVKPRPPPGPIPEIPLYPRQDRVSSIPTGQLHKRSEGFGPVFVSGVDETRDP